jgi:dihydrofolate synthase/folylpolyglutamate synthase
VKPLPGRHQRDNAVVALRLLEAAEAAGLGIDLGRAAAGFAGAHWPGRLQRIAGRPPLLLDGAHNPSGASALADALREEAPFVLVFGAMADKDVAAVGRTLFPLARAVVLTRAPSARAAEPSAIAERVGPAAAGAVVEPDIGAALRAARVLAGRDGLVVVAGSLYLVGDVLRRAKAVRSGPRGGRSAR